MDLRRRVEEFEEALESVLRVKKEQQSDLLENSSVHKKCMEITNTKEEYAKCHPAAIELFNGTNEAMDTFLRSRRDCHKAAGKKMIFEKGDYISDVIPCMEGIAQDFQKTLDTLKDVYLSSEK